MGQLENAQAAIKNLEEELHTRQEALRIPSDDELQASVKVVQPAPPAADEDDEGVRVLPAPKKPPASVVDAEEVAAEVRTLRGVPSLADAETEAEEQQEAEATGTEEPEVVEAAAGAEGAIDSLFAGLRTVPEAVAEVAAPPEAPVEEEIPPKKKAPATYTGAAAEIRDRLLLPVQNRALRSTKRRLSELQNVALEDLRVQGDKWTPDAGPLEEGLRGDLLVLAQESYGAGFVGSEELTGSAAPRPKIGKGDMTTASMAFAAALAEELRSGLAAAREAGDEGRQLQALVSRIFRTWRSDTADTRIRDASRLAYHLGLLDALESSGAEAVQWVVGSRRCTDCSDQEGISSIAEARLDVVPPAHQECECTLVPA